jgi:Protein of unknown function (DUF1549)/Protein of unknown function (DUF1553)/Planctomycete cytochrome C
MMKTNTHLGPRFLLASLLSVTLLHWGVIQAFAQEPGQYTAEQLSFFEKKIRPILIEHCYKCHSEEAEMNGELSVDSRDALLKGGVSGPAIVPGNLKKSLLIAAVEYKDPDLEMPPDGRLPDATIGDLKQWVEMGVPDPRVAEATDQKPYNPESAKTWWAYQPITAPEVPKTKNAEWPSTEIDRFVLAGLEARGLQPVGPAEKASLLRRVFIDLTGLPPTPDQQEKFLASDDPKQYERIVDWLLDQPQYGERWGRHWLDVARYAETTGRDLNLTMPEAWRYRDYVIQSFNEDKPFDQFIIEQLAGDLLPTKSEKERVPQLIATGFLAVGPKGLNESDPRQFAVELADEQIDATSQAFLGMTVSCARCHDHKFDPITQTDYTALAGIFLSTKTHYGTPGGVRARNASDLIEISESKAIKTLGRRMDPKVYAEKQTQLEVITKRRDEVLRSRAPQQRQGGGQQEMQQGGNQVSGFDIVRMMTRAKQIEVELAAFNPDGSAKPLVMAVSDKPTRIPNIGRDRARPMVGGPNTRGRTSSGFETIADSPLFLRGSIENQSEKVPRGLPEFLSHGTRLNIARDSSGRLELARWIASELNTLTSRVIVNRVWHWLFGRGLVESVDNLGASGTLPSNQQLLDYLATRFTRDRWSIKKLVREIVLSRVYQLDTRHDEANYRADPDNSLLWRCNSRRLDAESIRDGVLAASGKLDTKPVPGSLIALAGDGPVGGDRLQAIGEDKIAAVQANYRSVYLPVSRSVQPESLAIFDFADPSLVGGARNTTIVPPQALYLMNGDFMDQHARAMAKRVMDASGFEKRLSLACKLTLCREPYPDEIAAAKKIESDDLESWTTICRALLSSADFLFLN